MVVHGTQRFRDCVLDGAARVRDGSSTLLGPLVLFTTDDARVQEMVTVSKQKTVAQAGPILTPATMAAADVTLDVPATQPTIPWQQAYAA